MGYLKDYSGSVNLLSDIDQVSRIAIEEEAYNNEAGAYSMEGFQPGTYSVEYWFKVVPPLEFDEDYIHLNLMLADSHIYYDYVKIVLEDNGQIDSVYLHPPTLKESREGNAWVFTGKSTNDEILEFEILFDSHYKDQLSGVYSYVNDVNGLTTSVNNKLKTEYFAASLVFFASKGSGFLMPLVLFFVWYYYGREKEYTVPEYLSTVPVNGRKPWLVNLVFKKSVTEYDEDALYATLIDLHLRNKIKISQSDSLSIQIMSDTGLDCYEAETMRFLKEASENGLVTQEGIMTLVGDADFSLEKKAKAIGLKFAYNGLVFGTNSRVASEFTVNGKRRLVLPGIFSVLLIFAVFLGFLFSGSTEDILLSSLGYSVLPLIQVVVALLFPATLFGYWRKDYYKEKLEWESFKRHLVDFSRISQYGAEDLGMWGSWLVYGTALGVGKQVSDSLKKINVPISIPLYVPELRTLFTPIMAFSYSVSSSGGTSRHSYSSSSSRSGGGFGSSGGFGGGGSGVR